MNVSYNIEYESVTLTCPHCQSTVEIDARDFLKLLNINNSSRMCVDCRRDFMVTTALLDPRSPTLREPVAPIPAAVPEPRPVPPKTGLFHW